MKLRIIGSGEAFEDQGHGNNSCLLSGRDVPTVLFDCGYQIPERLWTYPEYRKLDAVYFTHLHADHSFGVVPLLTRYWEEGRKQPLSILGPKGTRAFVTRLMQMGYPGILAKLPFTLDFEELVSGDEIEWRGLRFRVARSSHSVVNLAVRVERKRGTVAHSFAISGDGDLTPATRRLFRGVDLLLHEVFSATPGIPVHANFQELREFVAESRIRRVGVTHLSRISRRALERQIKGLARKEPVWVILKPGMSLGF